MYDFYSEFGSALNEGNVSLANASLMKELAAILVNNKQDFIDLLNESGISADIDMSDAELIKLFVDNAPTNKKLIFGASLLVNIKNKKVGFDGEDEIDDNIVKQSYFTMKSCFVDSPNPNDEEFSYFPIGLIAGGIAKLAGKGINAAKERKAAKEKMQEEARRRREEQLRKAEEERKKRQQNIYIFGGLAVLGVLIIGIVLIRRK
jgi:hypothetical protein